MGLETEFMGNEHSLYLSLCTKYQIADSERLCEFFGVSGNSICDKLMENRAQILCAECDEAKDFTHFDADELAMGYFAGCRECAKARGQSRTIKWKAEWTADSIEVQEKDLVIRKTRNGHQGATSNLKPPMKRGQHCFRWLFTHHQTWIFFGIAEAKNNDSSLYCAQRAYGLASSSGGYRDGRSFRADVRPNHIYDGATEKMVDMKVDLKKGELSFMVVDDPEKRVVTFDEVKDSEIGFAPAVSMYYNNHTVQVKRVPVSWFGKNKNRTKFKSG